jgi:hypothetical protein
VSDDLVRWLVPGPARAGNRPGTGGDGPPGQPGGQLRHADANPIPDRMPRARNAGFYVLVLNVVLVLF